MTPYNNSLHLELSPFSGLLRCFKYMPWLHFMCQLWQVTARVRRVDKCCHCCVLAEIDIMEVFHLWYIFWNCNILQKSLNRLQEGEFISTCMELGQHCRGSSLPETQFWSLDYSLLQIAAKWLLKMYPGKRFHPAVKLHLLQCAERSTTCTRRNKFNLDVD